MTDSIRTASIPTGPKRTRETPRTFVMAGIIALAGVWPALANPTNDTCADHNPGALSPAIENGLATDASPTDAPDVMTLKRKWQIEREGILRYLNKDKAVDARALGTLLPHGRYASRIVPLNEHAYLIAEARNAGAFIADGEAGQYRVVWDTGRVDKALQCANDATKVPQVYAGLLPGPHDGSRRFYVMTACVFPGMNNHGSARFVLVRWHDGAATKELDRYISFVSGMGAPRLIGETLHVFGSGGRERILTQQQGWPLWDWTIVPRPDGFETCGWNPADRERDVVDRLIDGIDQGRSVNDLAEPQAITRLANALSATPTRSLSLWPYRPGETLPVHTANIHLGFLMQWCIRRGLNGRIGCTRDVPPNPSDIVGANANPSISTACLAAEENAFFTARSPARRRFRFTFRYRDRQPYVSDIEVFDANEECRA